LKLLKFRMLKQTKRDINPFCYVGYILMENLFSKTFLKIKSFFLLSCQNILAKLFETILRG
jgi:hypothetical protein